MPPIKTFIFLTNEDYTIEIKIETYGDEKRAFKKLENHVKDASIFYLKK
ncbi:hypothetical protein [Polaribacter sp.]